MSSEKVWREKKRKKKKERNSLQYIMVSTLSLCYRASNHYELNTIGWLYAKVYVQYLQTKRIEQRRLLNCRRWSSLGDMAKQAQSFVSYCTKERLATRNIQDFSIGHMSVYGTRKIFRMAHISIVSRQSQRYFVVDHVSQQYNRPKIQILIKT